MPSSAARPGVIGRNAPASSDETLAKEALEGLKRIRAKARLDKMAIPRTVPVAVRPAVIVAKPPAPRPPWVVPLATLAVAVSLIVCACTGVIVYLTCFILLKKMRNVKLVNMVGELVPA